MVLPHLNGVIQQVDVICVTHCHRLGKWTSGWLVSFENRLK